MGISNRALVRSGRHSTSKPNTSRSKLCVFLAWVVAAGLSGRSIYAGDLPTHGGVVHLNSGDVAVGLAPVTFNHAGSDRLTSPPNGYHWEIEIGNTLGFDEKFAITFHV